MKDEQKQNDSLPVTIPKGVQKDQIALLGGLNHNQQDFIVQWLENNFNVSKACENLGISRSTYYGWMNKKEFTDALATFNLGIAYLAMQTVVDTMLNSTDDAIRLRAGVELLKGLHPNFRQKIDVTTDGEKLTGLTLNILNVNGQTP